AGRDVSVGVGDFYELRLELVIRVSAEHGEAVDDVLDAISEIVRPEVREEAEDATTAVRVAIIGRPNVGKSSLLNRLLNEERSVVSPISGTTRDAIDEEIERNGRRYLLIDTAGIRRQL